MNCSARKKQSIIFFALTVFISGCSLFEGNRTISCDGLKLEIDNQGRIIAAETGPGNRKILLAGFTELEGCEVESVSVKRNQKSIVIEKSMRSGDRVFSCREVLSSRNNSIQWEIKITDLNLGWWSVPVKTYISYPADQNTSFWTAWADPRQGKMMDKSDDELIGEGLLPEAEFFNDWADPLAAIPMQNAKLWYGTEPFSYERPVINGARMNAQKNTICIPMATILDEPSNSGLSVILSPDDILLSVSLETTEQGDIVFSRENYRLGNGKELSFSIDIAAHEADIRAALKFITEKYPAYFNLQNPRAGEMEGMFAYSRNWGDFDVPLMKKMGFRTNWKASHDMPWMGMFVPPVEDTVVWKGFERNKNNEDDLVSINKMCNYSEYMVKKGFQVLHYMNVCEFGTEIQASLSPGEKKLPDEDLWKNANAFFHRKMKDAVVLRKGADPAGPLTNKDFYYSWFNCLTLDCGEPVYQDFLVDQIRKHIEEFPASSGFNVDRMDWLRLYNLNADDGITWFDNRPVRSLNISYDRLMDRVYPMLQEAGKCWFLDPNGVRIDIMNRADGILEEQNTGQALNSIALMCLKKPVGAWVLDNQLNGKDDQELDAFFQLYLYLGIWPMAPFPENDHSILPDPAIESFYLDYAPLFKTLYGKQWVLEPHILKTDIQTRINMFKTNEGYAIPVMFAPAGRDKVVVEVKKEYVDGKKIHVFHPGDPVEESVHYEVKGEYAQIKVPLVRRCAMIVISE